MNSLIKLDHLIEDLAQDLIEVSKPVIEKARQLSYNARYNHKCNNILNGLGGSIQLYSRNEFTTMEANNLLIQSIYESVPKLELMQNDLEQMKADKELRIMKLQDKYQWWSK